MTITLKQESPKNGYHLSIDQEKHESAYKVRLSVACGDYYRLERENIYSDMKSANKRVSALKRMINNGTI